MLIDFVFYVACLSDQYKGGSCLYRIQFLKLDLCEIQLNDAVVNTGWNDGARVNDNYSLDRH